MRRLKILFFLAIAVGTTLAQQPGRQITISGRVVDPFNKPIAGARVEAYRGSKLLTKPWFTKADGEYVITLEEDGPIDTLRFDHSDFLPGTIDHLAGSGDQRINKVLYHRGTELSYLQLQETLFAFERIQAIDMGELRQQNFTSYQYGSSLDQIGSSIDRFQISAEMKEDLRRRITTIRQAYGLAATLPQP